MEFSIIIGVNGNILEWVLKLNKSLYGFQQAIVNWFETLTKGHEKRAYHKSQVIYLHILHKKLFLLMSMIAWLFHIIGRQLCHQMITWKMAWKGVYFQTREVFQITFGVNIKNNLAEIIDLPQLHFLEKITNRVGLTFSMSMKRKETSR